MHEFMTIRRRPGFIWSTLLVFLCWATITQPLYAISLTTKGYPKIDLSGSNNLSLNINDVKGSQNSFQDDNYQRGQTFTRSSDLHLSGELYKDLQFTANLSANQYAPDQFTWNMLYDGGSAKTKVGEFTTNLGGNEFVTLNRALTGVESSAVLPKGTLTVVGSTLKSPVYTMAFDGQNTNGPYFLTPAPIVTGSEVVRVNDQVKKRDADYSIDYTNGILNFSSTYLISPVDHVVVSFEASTGGSGSGRLTAVRASYPFGSKLTVGATHLQLQGKPTGGGSERVRNEVLTNDASGLPDAYYLSYRPIVAGSELVRVNSYPQTPDIAYTLDPNTGKITFKAGFVPRIHSTVIVDYTRQIPATAGENRSVTGVDVDWKAGKLGVNLQAAQSQGGSTSASGPQIHNEQFYVQPIIAPSAQSFKLRVTPIIPGTDTVRASGLPLVRDTEYTLNYTTGDLRILRDNIAVSATGPTLSVTYSTEASQSAKKGNTAFALTTTYNGGRGTARAAVRSVAPGFTPLERAGYRNVQQATSWGGDYVVTKRVTVSTDGDNTRVPYDSYTSDTSSPLMEEKNRSYSIEYHPENLPVVSLRRQTRDATQPDGNQLGEQSSTDMLQVRWQKNALDAHIDLTRRVVDSKRLRTTDDSGASTTNSIYNYNAKTNDASVGLDYQVTQKLKLSAATAANRIDSLSDGATTRTTGNNSHFSANYQATDQLAFSADLQARKTGATTTSSGTSVPATKGRDLSLTADWHSKDSRVSVNTSYLMNNSEGGDYSNSTSRIVNSTVLWRPTDAVSLQGYWNKQNLDFLGATGKTTTNMVGVTPTVQMGRATLTLDGQHVWGTNPSGVSQMMLGQSRAHLASTFRADSTTDNAIATSTSTRNTTLSGKLSYPIADKHEVFVDSMVGWDGGDQNDARHFSAGLGWTYHLGSGLDFTVDAQSVQLNDKITPSRNYRARSVNASLAWNF
jgi:hypothetical protein